MGGWSSPRTRADPRGSVTRPNDQAHLPGGLGKRRTSDSLHARRVRCSAWFGIRLLDNFGYKFVLFFFPKCCRLDKFAENNYDTTYHDDDEAYRLDNFSL